MRWLTTVQYAREILGGARSVKTIARWCRQGMFAEGQVRRLPNGDWIIHEDADPPAMKVMDPADSLPPMKPRASLVEIARGRRAERHEEALRIARRVGEKYSGALRKLARGELGEEADG
jgi:hypothetical protein